MRRPRLAGAGARTLLPLVGILAGCGGPAGADRLEEGRYHYVASHAAPAVSGSVRLEGVLVITESGSDSVSGVWEVPDLHPELDLGQWVDSLAAYELMANPTYFGVLTHRVRLQEGAIRCEGDYTWVADGGFQRTVPVTCSITREDVERPEMPAVGAEDPIVREIDSDTIPPRGLSSDTVGGPRTDSTGGSR